MLFYEKSNQKDKIVSILKEADEVIALSAEWKKKFDETFGLKNCVVLENGIDTERLKPAITRSIALMRSYVPFLSPSRPRDTKVCG